MTQTSYPWAGLVLGDAGPYSAIQWNDLWKVFLGIPDSNPNTGIFFLDNNLTVSRWPLRVAQEAVASNKVRIFPGKALIEGIFYKSDATELFTITAESSGNPRIDTVILRANYAAQTVRLAVLEGTPGAVPSRPSLTQTLGILWEIPIADIAVANGFVTILDANITNYPDLIIPGAQIIPDVLNNSGIELKTGDVVVWDATVTKAVTTSVTSLPDDQPAGVWLGLTAAASRGRVLQAGPGLVNVSSAVGGINWGLKTGTTAKAAVYGEFRCFARTSEAWTTAGLVSAKLFANMSNVQRYPGRSTLKHKDATVLVGNAIAVAIDNAIMDNHYGRQNAAAINDAFIQSFLLEAGTYDIVIEGREANGNGQVTWYLDSVNIATNQEWYAAASARKSMTVAGVAINTSGRHTLKGIVAAKNGASAGYLMQLSCISIKPTSEPEEV